MLRLSGLQSVKQLESIGNHGGSIMEGILSGNGTACHHAERDPCELTNCGCHWSDTCGVYSELVCSNVGILVDPSLQRDEIDGRSVARGLLVNAISVAVFAVTQNGALAVLGAVVSREPSIHGPLRWSTRKTMGSYHCSPRL